MRFKLVLATIYVLVSFGSFYSVVMAQPTTPQRISTDSTRTDNRRPLRVSLPGAALSLVPGLGQLHQGKTLRAVGYGGSFAVALMATYQLDQSATHAWPVAINGERSYITNTSAISSFALMSAQNILFYGMYDAYTLGRETPLPLIRKSVDPRYLRSLFVSVPLIILSANLFAGYNSAAINDSELLYNRVWGQRRISRSGALLGASAINLTASSFIGVGEEALFRGVIQHSLQRRLPDWAAISVASSLFGLAHYANNNSWRDVGYTALYGMYLGTMAHVDNYDLGRAVFLHTAWDFLIFLHNWLHNAPVSFINMQITIPLK